MARDQGLQRRGPPKGDDCCGEQATEPTLEPSIADFGAFRGFPAWKESPSEAIGATWRTLEPVPCRGRRGPMTWFCPWRSPPIRALLSQLCELCGDRSSAKKVFLV